jgi:hypothetical protein
MITRNGNGSVETAPAKTFAHNAAELMHDMVALGELQAALTVADTRESLQKLIVPTVTAMVGALLLLACLPIALVAIALLVDDLTVLNITQSFFATLAGAVVIGGAATWLGISAIKHGWPTWQRSRQELKTNIRWLKNALKRFGGAPPCRETEESFYRRS